MPAAELMAMIFFCLLARTLSMKASVTRSGPATLVWMN